MEFDLESNGEIVRVKSEDSGLWEEGRTGDYIFENEWQPFRTGKDRPLEMASAFHECTPARCKPAVKVMDIFGNVGKDAAQRCKWSFLRSRQH